MAKKKRASILYINFWACFSWLFILPLLRAVIQDAFPQAESRAFVALSRYDSILEGQFAAALLEGAVLPFDWREAQSKSPVYQYAVCLNEIFSVFGRDSVECFVPEPDSETPEDRKGLYLDSQTAFWNFAGMEMPRERATGFADFHTPLEFHLPLEFWAFCETCNTLRNKPYPLLRPLWEQRDTLRLPDSGPPPPFFTSPWAEQTTRFADWPGTIHSPFSPAERAAFVAAHEADNAETAALLGRERLFAPVDVNQPWEPFPGLTEEGAFQVAERLSPDFAADLLEQFKAVPFRQMTREQLLCRHALHDALAPPSTMPLPHRGRLPKVSVCTLTYNHADYIAGCIEGVLAQQTDFPIQHIIADDGSNDGTQDIILDHAAKYPHIVPVFQKKRSWGVENIRALFDLARTEYVALCDGDDYFTDPAKLQTQADLLDANQDAALCFHSVRVLYEGAPGRERLYPPEEALPRGIRPFYYLVDLLRNNFIQTNAVMYRWRFRNGLPDWFRTDLVPGDRYWHLLHAETGKIAFIDKVMSVYRRHKKGAYYLSEIDRLKHRATTGMAELEAYKVINAHFGGKFEAMLLPLAYGVFMDCSRYDAQRAKEEGREPVLDDLCAAYPDFARHFLDAQTRMSDARAEQAAPQSALQKPRH